MGGFLKGPDLVQKLRDLDISSASFTTHPSDKALLMASIEGAGHLPTFSASIRELLLEAARAAAITMEAASAAADEAARTAAATAEAAKQQGSGNVAHDSQSSTAAEAQAAAEASKQAAQDVQLDYALAVYRAAAVLEACELQQGAVAVVADSCCSLLATIRWCLRKAGTVPVLLAVMCVLLVSSTCPAEAHDLYRAALDISNEELGGEHAAVECNTLLGKPAPGGRGLMATSILLASI
jgi:hypothetical protein